jgi:hypothetical protein
MQKPLSNLDYLISRPEVPPAAVKESASSSAERAVEETAVASGSPIVAALARAPQGQQTAFELVDTLGVRLEDLFQVFDILSSKFQWITVDRSDPKGNYRVALTDRGRAYAQYVTSANGPR